MRILAFNSSPRDNQTGKTEPVLQKFLEGARRAGAETPPELRRQFGQEESGKWGRRRGRRWEHPQAPPGLRGAFG